MNHLSLFSGIGGLDLAAEAAGFTTIAFVEINPFCQAILKKRWPSVTVLSDVATLTKDKLKDDIHIISGGFPCQPHSVAGSRRASSDERDLWPAFSRCIDTFKPRWVVGENVQGLFTSEQGRFFGSILYDLASLGYSVGWGMWAASLVGAPIRRNRIFFVAFDKRQRGEGLVKGEDISSIGPWRWRGKADMQSIVESPRERGDRWPQPIICRMDYGLPDRVDRLRALGNAVVPQQAFELFRAIANYERSRGRVIAHGPALKA